MSVEFFEGREVTPRTSLTWLFALLWRLVR